MAFDYSGISDKISGLEEKYGLPSGLYAAVIEAGERSGPKSVSPKGAIGYAQLMPATASQMGVDPWNIDQNLDGGAKYLAAMYKQFGDPLKAAGHYNAGPGGDLDNDETRPYIDRVRGKFMPDAAAAQTPTSPTMDPAMQADLQKRMGHADQVSEVAGKQVAEIGEQERRIMAEPLPPRAVPPTLKDLPLPQVTVENRNGRNVTLIDGKESDPTRVLGQFLPMIAILGSLTTRRAATGAMSAAASAMNAARQNDKDALEEAHKTFKEHVDRIIQENDLERQRYLDVMEDRKLSMAEKISELQALAAIGGNAQEQALIANGQVDQLYKYWQMKDLSVYRVAQIHDMSVHQETENKRIALEQERVQNEASYHAAEIELRKAQASHESLSQFVARQIAEKQAAGPKWTKERESLLEEAEKDLTHLPYAGGEGAGGAEAGAAQPLPADKGQLVKGTTYQTSRGPATWDGDQFVPAGGD